MNDIEWVTGNWTDIKSGEPVRIQSEYGSIEGKAVHVDDDNTSVLVQYLLTNSTRVHRLAGMQVFVKAAPVVVLPTEPGIYQDCEGDPWRLGRLGWKLLTSDPPDAFKPEDHVPFTRLEPVSETAKKVLDRVRILRHDAEAHDLSGASTRDMLRELINVLAIEFEATK